MLALLLSVTGVVIAGEIAFENEVNREVATVLSDGYGEIELVEVQTRFADGRVANGDRQVAIVAIRPAGERYPGLPDVLANHISDRTDATVSVEIEYVDRDRSGGGRTTM